MQRSPSQWQSRCEHHDFRLYPIADSIYNGQYYNVSFCTCKTERPPRRPVKNPHRNSKHLAFPRFNKDGNFSTPAFILNVEKNYYESEGPRMRIEHEHKMEGYNEEKVQINIPKPRSKNNYCSVCKGSYEDYLEHIVSEMHKRRIHQSAFNRDILELGMRFESEHLRNRGVPSLEKNLSTRIEDSEQLQIISQPHKLIKPNEELQNPIPQQQQQQTCLPSFPRPSHYPQIPPLQLGTGLGVGNILLPPQPPTFKPFSAMYQEQMNQFVLNLNIFLSPYSLGMGPYVGLPPSMEAAVQARQQLSALQCSLFNQISACNQMQQLQLQLQAQHLSTLSIAHSPPVYSHPMPSPFRAPPPSVIVIDE